MSWTNLRRIFVREIRDQLRDRRTLFTTLLLPLMMYPILGLVVMQIAQFVSESSSKVQVVGSEFIAELPPLFEEEQVVQELAGRNGELLDLTFEKWDSKRTTEQIYDAAGTAIDNDQYDAVIIFPPGLQQRLLNLKTRVTRLSSKPEDSEPDPDSSSATVDNETEQLKNGPWIVFNSVDDKSEIAQKRVMGVLEKWQVSIKDSLFRAGNIPLEIAEPIVVVPRNTAPEESRSAEIWASIIPMMLLMWTLSGAFYPAVDLCAGEKERGTLETLLCGPAKRIEIVGGKLLTIMTFSFFTSLFNLLSIAFTGVFMIGRMMPAGSPLHDRLGSVPGWSILWSLVVLVPLVAMFSALALSAATFARSSKEGQYYMMPLLILCMPLMMISMMPNVELNLGTSLIPVAGAALLLRNLIESQFEVAIRFGLPVIFSSMFCCYLALRWATAQFNSESVLFRESEKWEFKLWIRQYFRNPRAVPTAAMAICLALLVLVLRFFANAVVPEPTDWQSFLMSNSLALMVTVGVPAVLAAWMLTTKPWVNLKIRKISVPVFAIALLLPLAIQPLIGWIGVAVQWLYPVSPAMEVGFTSLMGMLDQAPWWWVFVAIALVPAVFEELAFRGFMLSGLQTETRDWTAILITAAFFGITHGILQQSLSAGFMGILLGYVAVRTDSILPTMMIHLIHNGIVVMTDKITTIESLVSRFQMEYTGIGSMYSPVSTAVGTLVACGLIYLFHQKTKAT